MQPTLFHTLNKQILPLFDLDFRRGVYHGGGLNTVVKEAANTLASSYEWSDGVVRTSVGSTPQITDNGLEVWPDRTNSAIQSRDLSNAAWVKVNVTAVKNQTGVSGVANSASSITATANGATILQAITLASSTQMQSAYVKRLVGSGTLEMTEDGGLTWTAISPTTNWQRFSVPSQTLTNPNVGFRIGTNGDSFAIDYVQNENGNTVSPPIPTTTVAVNRPQCRLTTDTKPPINALIAGAFGFYIEAKIDSLGGRGLLVSDGQFQITAAVDGSVTCGVSPSVSTGAGLWNFSTFNKVAGYLGADARYHFSVNGAAVVSGLGALSPSLTHVDFGTNGAGTSNIRGTIRRVAFLKPPLYDYDIQRLATYGVF